MSLTDFQPSVDTLTGLVMRNMLVLKRLLLCQGEAGWTWEQALHCFLGCSPSKVLACSSISIDTDSLMQSC